MKNLKWSLLAFSMGAMTAVVAQESTNNMPPQRDNFFETSDANADGVLSLDEFKTGKEKLESKRLEKRRQLFAEIDVNDDGMVSVDEFARFKPNNPGVNKKGGKVQKKDMTPEKLFVLLDKNMDGVVSKAEFPGAGATRKSSGVSRQLNVDRLFEKLDIDKNDQLSFAEFKKAKHGKPKSDKEKKKVFDRIDTDSNGVLSKEEFQVMGTKGRISRVR